jgi:N-acetylglucosaminyldiphosphoundecaprenol N-acetyl-beta-D-mannosaminyltransferase
MNGADLTAPDGMPLVFGLRRLGLPRSTRVYGPALMRAVLAEAARRGVPVGFYGAAPHVLAALRSRMRSRLEGLEVAYAVSPPFRELSSAEDRDAVAEMNASGARILFVGLGCPKQERWMAAHQGSVHMPMLGVGAAFDFLAGEKRQAPRWMQRAGLEWLFRLATEPKRLWKRYLKHNPRFVILFGLQLIRSRPAT